MTEVRKALDTIRYLERKYGSRQNVYDKADLLELRRYSLAMSVVFGK